MKYHLLFRRKEVESTDRKVKTPSLTLIVSTLFLTFSNIPAWATNLGTAQISATADSLTCFGQCYGSSERYSSIPNSSVKTAYSIASNSVILTPKETTISTYAEANPLKGGSIDTDSFTTRAESEVGLDYYFEITGAHDITIPVLVNALGDVHVTSQSAAATTGFGYYARLQILGDGIFVLNQEVFNQSNVSTVDHQFNESFGANQYYNLKTNTPYEVNEIIRSDAVYQLPGLTGTGRVTSLVSIDPSFTIDPAYASQYSIQFSNGLDIGSVVSPVPLPSAAPMFGAALLALGTLGYGVKRRNAASTA